MEEAAFVKARTLLECARAFLARSVRNKRPWLVYDGRIGGRNFAPGGFDPCAAREYRDAVLDGE